MPRRVEITTPEHVRIEYELAGVYSRACASLIDLLFQALGCLLIGLVLLAVNIYVKAPVTSWVNAIVGIVLFVIVWGYYVYFETIWNGQTPGKRYTALRVVREGGLPIDFSCAAIRNLIRVIDLLPVVPPYIVGFFSIVISGRNKRLGDYAAGTLVIRERASREGNLRPQQIGPAQGGMGPMLVINIELVTPEQFEAAKRFVVRRSELKPQIAAALAESIAKPIMAHLGISSTLDYSGFLNELYERCMSERGMR